MAVRRSAGMYGMSHRGSATGRENKCQLCDALERFSRDIQREAFFEVTEEPNGLPIGPEAYLHKTSEEAIKNSRLSVEFTLKIIS